MSVNVRLETLLLIRSFVTGGGAIVLKKVNESDTKLHKHYVKNRKLTLNCQLK
jgi:hypothetical protein